MRWAAQRSSIYLLLVITAADGDSDDSDDSDVQQYCNINVFSDVSVMVHLLVMRVRQKYNLVYISPGAGINTCFPHTVP